MSAQVRSYALLLPPGWCQLPVDAARGERAVDALVQEVFDGLPRDSAGPWRRRLREALLEQVARAREADALDLYLPAEPLHGRAAGASFLVAHIPGPQDGPESVDGAVAALAALAPDPELGRTEQVSVAGRPALRSTYLRTSADVDGVLEGAPRRDSRHVDYLVSVPGGGVLLLAFSTIALTDADRPRATADGPRFDDLLVELFDAIVSTLRWRTA